MMDRLKLRVRRKIRREFSQFKQNILRHYSKEAVWENCHRIYFYVSVKEYFEYNERIPGMYLSLALITDQLLDSMWNCYLEHEEFDFYTWNELDELLDFVLLDWNQPMAG
jgi:hypothetical protein